MRRLWVINHLCEFQALTDNFLMWEWIVFDNSSLSDNSILTLCLEKYAFAQQVILEESYTCFNFFQ